MSSTTRGAEPVAEESPSGSSVVVRRFLRGTEFLVLHRNAEGPAYAGNWAWTSPGGRREPGEPIYPAALRELREQTAIAGTDVWAVDLSGRWAVFATDFVDDVTVDPSDAEHDRYEWLTAAEATGRILPAHLGETQIARTAAIPPVELGFRPLTHADLPEVMAWQQLPHVERWYHRDDPANASESYAATIDGVDPTRMWMLEVDGRPVGFVQDYRIGDHPEWAVTTGEPDAIGFDYAIGDLAWVGKGVGTRALWVYLRDVVRPHYPDATKFYAAPDHRNAASLRVLDKLGFTQGLWFDEPRAGGGVDTVVSCTLDVPRMFG